MKVALVLAPLLLAVLPVSAAVAEEPAGPLAPRNLCGSLPGFAAFETKLKDAIARRDADLLMQLASEDVALDFGGGAGKQMWRDRLDGEYNNWSDLAGTVALGCDRSAQADSAAYPYFWSNHQGNGDPYAAMLVTGNNVLLRSGPSPHARVKGRVSWNWVTGGYEAPVNGYHKVTTLSGQTGYMAEPYLRSLIDFRLIVSNTDDGWKITAFIAGD
ncbi:SH3 domain-containing protein [Pontixanthobacter aquaemixtae]|uniref:SH3b domain-containing protein n=1 Tax=Pontixanthobacter aquaemixtae TaxID=1958940 RepID=A0A844ZPD8_9SPHN|nr:hypothetical protein [Pontixanthobacter aquaemixtae]MXO89603.1 hypothetical protein [Pontixanthobacter aquaemixtae]